MQPMLKAPGTKRLTVRYVKLLSSCGFDLKFGPYAKGMFLMEKVEMLMEMCLMEPVMRLVGRPKAEPCRLTPCSTRVDPGLTLG